MVEMIPVYYLVTDAGDGSTYVNFYKKRESAEALLGDDEYCTNDEVGEFQIPAGPNTINFSD